MASAPTANVAPTNADIDRDSPEPEIHVEERRLTLHDFLKTAIKINEQLDKRGQRLEDVSPREFCEILQKAVEG